VVHLYKSKNYIKSKLNGEKFFTFFRKYLKKTVFQIKKRDNLIAEFKEYFAFPDLTSTILPLLVQITLPCDELIILKENLLELEETSTRYLKNIDKMWHEIGVCEQFVIII
jgi:hypothetical protein